MGLECTSILCICLFASLAFQEQCRLVQSVKEWVGVNEAAVILELLQYLGDLLE